MTVLITGCAGFIGSHMTAYMLDRGEQVIGIDNLNSYYDVNLKQARLSRISERKGFSFYPIDITDQPAVTDLCERHANIDSIIHLAAQAGVRYSLAAPLTYVDANIKGQVILLEIARRLKALKVFVYASSSSVYGANPKQPFSVDDRVDSPVSLYAATKRAAELMTEAYCSTYRMSCVGLRFFSVYGPWGRPDMAYYMFTDAIVNNRPIRVFNEGRMARDFTYVDDILPTIAAAAALPDIQPGEHRLYNIGNHRPESLLDFINVIERTLGQPAICEMAEMQPADVPSTYADVAAAQRDLGFEPHTTIDIGLSRFIAWYREYHGPQTR